MGKDNGGRARVRKHRCECLALLSYGLLSLMLLTACGSPPSASSPTLPAPAPASCITKECFINSANDCNELSMTLSEEAGVFKYSSSKDCVFTKTLVTLSANETQEMKNLLEGKSFICRYEKGKFDSRWVTSLIFGTEYCEGELRDILGKLMLFV